MLDRVTNATDMLKSIRVPLACLATIALLNGLFSQFDSFYERFRPSRVEKLEQYDALLAGTLKADTVFVGSSTVNMGVDPIVFDQFSGVTSFNAGQLGYAPINLTEEVIREIVSNQSADRIILALDSWSLNPEIRNRAIVDTLDRGEHFLWDWALYRNREIFFFWLQELANGNLNASTSAWHRHMETGGRFERLDAAISHKTGYLQIDGSLNPDWPSYIRPTDKVLAEPASKLRAIMEIAQQNDIEIFILRMPEYSRTYEENQQAHAYLREVIATEAAQFDVKVVDFSIDGAFPHSNTSFFFDFHHLNQEGAELLSELLGHEFNALVIE